MQAIMPTAIAQATALKLIKRTVSFGAKAIGLSDWSELAAEVVVTKLTVLLLVAVRR